MIAQKKLLETELLSLVEATNVLRFQIRQKQDEIDELERETEDAYNVDMSKSVFDSPFLFSPFRVCSLQNAEAD